MSEPFAVQLYRRYLDGETIQQLADNLEIPADRVEQRLRAAVEFLKNGGATRRAA